MKSVAEARVKDKNVVFRVGFDVPISDGKITDDSRIKASMPTIELLQKNGAKQIFLVTHLGRPEGQVDIAFSLSPIADRLAELLNASTPKKNNLNKMGYDFSWEVYEINDQITLLENIRFSPDEEKDLDKFGKKLASLGDIFVNDAFSVCHRANASISSITKYIDSYAGLSLIKELDELNKLIKNPARPFGVIIGGAKTEDKLPAIKNLANLADFFLLGGVVANTFLVARGHNIGKSLYDKDLVDDAKKIWTQIMDDPNRDIFLPRDFIVSQSTKEPKDQQTIDVKDIEKIKDSDYAIVDIGPKTVELYKAKINTAKTIFWNGNLGITEVKDFAKGSEEVAGAISDVDCYSVVGGGDTGGFVDGLGLSDRFGFISTGGGATLDYLAGKTLPGIKALG